jgi:hypothetical protein
MEPEGSLSSSQEPDPGPYPEPNAFRCLGRSKESKFEVLYNIS